MAEHVHGRPHDRQIARDARELLKREQRTPQVVEHTEAEDDIPTARRSPPATSDDAGTLVFDARARQFPPKRARAFVAPRPTTLFIAAFMPVPAGELGATWTGTGSTALATPPAASRAAGHGPRTLRATSAISVSANRLPSSRCGPIKFEEDADRQRSANRSVLHAFACRALRVRHPCTRPCRPRANGKAEHFAPCSGARPTARSPPPTPNAPPPVTAGCGPTTIADHVTHSATAADRPPLRKLNNLPGTYN